MDFQSLFHGYVKEVQYSELNILEGVVIFTQQTVCNSGIKSASWDSIAISIGA
jgi:hypothetical protein